MLWCNGFKLDNWDTEATVIWEIDKVKKKWHEQNMGLGRNTKIFDAEILGISKALKVAE